MDGRGLIDGQEPGRAPDLGFAPPESPTAGTPTAGTPPQVTVPYGQPGPYAAYAPGPQAPSNPRATASLVLGIVSLFLSLLFVPSIVGVVLGITGLARSRRSDPPTGRGAAITGIVLSVLGAVLGVLLAVVGSNAIADLAETVFEESASTADEDGGDGLAGHPEDEAQPFDPKDFEAVDAAQWSSIVEEPRRAAGRAVVVFAEVARFDSSTGADRFLAVAGVDQPGTTFELQSTSVFIGDEAQLGGVETGDVLRIHAVVADTMKFETELGGISTIPALTVVRVEDVGFVDLSKDFTLGAAQRDQIGFLSVPVTVTNSGTQPFAYGADIVAESKDGSTTYEKGLVFVEDLKPGQTVEAQADFFEDVPADAVFRVERAERFLG